MVVEIIHYIYYKIACLSVVSTGICQVIILGTEFVVGGWVGGSTAIRSESRFLKIQKLWTPKYKNNHQQAEKTSLTKIKVFVY